jgi:hypothetical protein
MKRKWWLWFILAIGCLLIIVGVVALILSSKPEVKADIPQFSYDEVVAIVKQDLLKREVNSYKVIASYNYSGQYLGHGKWSGSCTILTEGIIEFPSESREGDIKVPQLLGPGEHYAINDTRLWNFYEKSQTVELK